MAAMSRVVIVGGGAAGFFAAIACAEKLGDRGTVVIYEATAHPLAKVRVSGGGRCNVTHACFEPRELVKNYPRGGPELLGAFHRFQPRDMISWLEARGVTTKVEEDGRVFPTTDDSGTIVVCLEKAAADVGVQIITSRGVRRAEKLGRDGLDQAASGFWLTLTDGTELRCEQLLLATGGNRSSAGWTMAATLGHTVIPPVPSLFTFHINDLRLQDLSGISVAAVEISAPELKLRASGALLVTHWGLSGPAVLKLSALGARGLAEKNYEFAVRVNFLGSRRASEALELLRTTREGNPRKQIATWNPFGLSQRLWEKLSGAAGLPANSLWTQTSNAALERLAAQLVDAEFKVVGKSLFKEEFVTAGGVDLREVDFRTMESRLCPGLFFAGEVLNIDGVTGGFNFQSAWTTGWLAGNAMAET